MFLDLMNFSQCLARSSFRLISQDHEAGESERKNETTIAFWLLRKVHLASRKFHFELCDELLRTIDELQCPIFET